MRSLALALAVALALALASSNARAACRDVADVAPGAQNAEGRWASSPDGRVQIDDVVTLLRAATGLVTLDDGDLQPGCPYVLGDLSPGEADSATAPPTWRPVGDGRVDIADVVAALRASVELQVVVLPELMREPKLRPVRECGEMLASLRRNYLEQVSARVEGARDSVLQALGGDCGWYWFEDVDADGTPPVPSTRNDAPSETSETNVQVAGVDEADHVKVVSGRIHVLADGRYQVVDAWPASAARVIGSLDIEGEPKRMYVHADRAVVFSSLDPLLPEPDPSRMGVNAFGAPVYYGGGDCTYGYDCQFTGDGRRLKVTVLDVAEPSAPRVAREVYLGASYVSSRRIAEAVHVVVTSPELTVPSVAQWPEELGSPAEFFWGSWCWDGSGAQYTEEQVNEAFDALLERNRRAVERAGLEEFLPSALDRVHSAGGIHVTTSLFADCTEVHVADDGATDSLLSVVSFDLTASEPLRTASIVGKPGAVYANAERLYVAARQDRHHSGGWYYPESRGVAEATTIHAFGLRADGPSSHYVGSGVAKGRVLNQFSMDEHEGHLRIATTSGHIPSPDAHSTVTVLRPDEGGLVTVGQVDRIAPTEDIRSVRFMGDRGYLVTFKKTDPLFSLDLAVPEAPRVAGELKIPGYSTYMHPLADGYLMSIGYDADDQGSFAWFTGILLQVFDVRDVASPQLVHRQVIGTRGTTSEAATNHLAFTYFRSRQALAVPVTVCNDRSGGGGSYGDRIEFSGLQVYRVDVDDGFELLGGLPYGETGEVPSCHSWWTDSASQVKRSVFMDDFTFAIGAERMRAAHLGELDVVLSEVSLMR